jgi:hypothetical protein
LLEGISEVRLLLCCGCDVVVEALLTYSHLYIYRFLFHSIYYSIPVLL